MGEFGEIEKDEVEIDLDDLSTIAIVYVVSHLWNPDEIGFSYNMPPDGAISSI